GVAQSRPAEPDAREQRRRRPLRDRLPGGVRQGDRQLARRELGERAGRRLQEERDRLRVVFYVVSGFSRTRARPTARSASSTSCFARSQAARATFSAATARSRAASAFSISASAFFFSAASRFSASRRSRSRERVDASSR